MNNEQLVACTRASIALVRAECYPEVECRLKNELGLPPDASREDLLASLRDELFGLMEAQA